MLGAVLHFHTWRHLLHLNVDFEIFTTLHRKQVSNAAGSLALKALSMKDSELSMKSEHKHRHSQEKGVMHPEQTDLHTRLL